MKGTISTTPSANSAPKTASIACKEQTAANVLFALKDLRGILIINASNAAASSRIVRSVTLLRRRRKPGFLRSCINLKKYKRMRVTRSLNVLNATKKGNF